MKAYSLDSEHREQTCLMKWADLQSGSMPELRCLFAIPNGGWRHPTTAARLKAEGVKPGVPDLFLAYPFNGMPGLFIEMKRRIGGRLSPEQQAWRERLSMHGYRVRVCKGWEEAKTEIIDYLTHE